MYTIYARAGWGSVMPEALLALSGQKYELIDVDPATNQAGWQQVEKLNPLRQLPTIIVPDGSVMTESGAIALYIAEDAPQARLAPPPGDGLRATWLRWQVYLVANIYACWMIEGHPERWGDDTRREDIVARSLAYQKQLWAVVERNAGAPWFLGDRFSTLDVFVSIMTRWAPRRSWFAQDCPKLIAIARAVDRMPALVPVWARNFGNNPLYQ